MWTYGSLLVTWLLDAYRRGSLNGEQKEKII